MPITNEYVLNLQEKNIVSLVFLLLNCLPVLNIFYD